MHPEHVSPAPLQLLLQLDVFPPVVTTQPTMLITCNSAAQCTVSNCLSTLLQALADILLAAPHHTYSCLAQLSDADLHLPVPLTCS